MAKEVFEPHFACEPIEFSDYDCAKGGAVKAIVHPVLFLGALVALVFAWRYRSSLAMTSTGVLVVASLLVARLQLRWCADYVKAVMSEKMVSARRVHVIAHSLGTFFTWRAMERADVEFDRVVLVGSVLPHVLSHSASWSSRVRRTDDSARGVEFSGPSVRNEVAGKDLVVWLAGLAGWLSRELGRSGWGRGFQSQTIPIHTAPDPWTHCSECESGRKAIIHNVALGSYYGHSTVFLGPGHAQRLWLPFLWGFEPAEFRDWLRLSSLAAEFLDRGDIERGSVLLIIIQNRGWRWTRDIGGGSRSLADYLRVQIELQMTFRRRGAATAEELARLVIRSLIRLVRIIDVAAQTGGGAAGDMEIRRRLHPMRAIAWSVAATLDGST
jgi:hypothetical protein